MWLRQQPTSQVLPPQASTLRTFHTLPAQGIDYCAASADDWGGGGDCGAACWPALPHHTCGWPCCLLCPACLCSPPHDGDLGCSSARFAANAESLTANANAATYCDSTLACRPTCVEAYPAYKQEHTTSPASCLPSSAGNLCTSAHLLVQGRCVTLRHQGVYAWLTVEQHAGLHCPTTLVAGHAACCALHACAPPHMICCRGLCGSSARCQR
jgi:hypothetical protein